MLFEPIVTFILKFKYIILFYLAIIIFFYIKRKQLDFQAKIIVLYRMKFGLVLIEKCSKKFKEWIILLGYIGTGVGFIGILTISYYMIKIIIKLITQPSTPTGVSLVLPGMNIPGLGILPFWYWLIVIFFVALIHEFSHGIVARAHNIEVKNTGLVLLGPIIGAFVEPNEKKLRKQSDLAQYSVLAAGSFSNILLGIFALLLLNLAFMPLHQTMIEPVGFTFNAYVDESYPFAKAGIAPGTLITGIDGSTTYKFEEFREKLFCTNPGDKIKVSTSGKTIPIILANNPDNPKKSFLGIQEIRNEVKIKDKYNTPLGNFAYNFLDWFTGLSNGGKGFLFWLYLLSVGIGMFNLLPLPIVDGGRMVQVFFHKLKGKDKGEKWYRRVGMFFLMILLITLLFPLIKGWFGI